MNRQYVDRTKHLPTFSEEEKERRWSDVRERMYQRYLDAILVWGNDLKSGICNANLRYLAQTPGTVDGIALFPLEGEPTVFSGFPHTHQPYSLYDAYQHWVTDTRPLEDVGQVVDEIESRGLDGGRIGIVGYGTTKSPPHLVPYPDFETLQQEFPHATFPDATDLLARSRLIKSEEEISMLREAGAIARKVAETLMDAEPGQDEAEVYADMTRAQIAEGGEAYVFNWFDSGSPTDSDFLHLLHGKPAPLAPTKRELGQGDLVISEYHVGYGGVLVGVEKSVVLGDPPAELADIHEVSLQCFDNALDSIRPGARFRDVVDSIRAPAEEANIDFVELGLHGHGFGSPEFPITVYPQEGTQTYPEGKADSPLSDRGIEDIRLREDMVFGLNIDVYDPDWREDVGLMLGDTVVVTDDGVEQLADTPRRLGV